MRHSGSCSGNYLNIFLGCYRLYVQLIHSVVRCHDMRYENNAIMFENSKEVILSLFKVLSNRDMLITLEMVSQSFFQNNDIW